MVELTEVQGRLVEEAAKFSGLSLGDFIRAALNTAIRKTLGAALPR
jgi:hypothetical protein